MDFMKNNEKTVFVIRTAGEYVSVATNMTEVYNILTELNEDWQNEEGKTWEDFPTYNQLIAKRRKLKERGCLFHTCLTDVDFYDPLNNLEIDEVYLNQR
jgi:hypothetical protein